MRFDARTTKSLILTVLVLGPLMAAGQTLSITDGIQTCTALTNTTVNLSGRSELHVAAIEGRVVGLADCLGDWREELITVVPGELHIYSTTIPATTRRVCLMQDRLYRTDVTMQSMGYFYPPQPGGKLLDAAVNRNNER